MPNDTFPGPAATWSGVTVEDFTLCNASYPAATAQWKDGAEATTAMFDECLQIESPTAEAMATYTSQYYSGGIALTRNRHGEGSAWYFGSPYTEDVALGILKETSVSSPVEGWMALPKQVELAIRGDLVFLLNYGHSAVELRFFQTRDGFTPCSDSPR